MSMRSNKRCSKPSNAYSRSELRVNRFPEVDPSILRETSPEAPPLNGLPHASTGEAAPKEQINSDTSQVKQRGETAAQPQSDTKRDQKSRAEGKTPVSKPVEPEDDIERDNNKINQIVAAVKNSSAIKLDILMCSDGSVHALTEEAAVINIGSLKTTAADCLGRDDHLLKCLHWGDFQIVLAEDSGLSIYQDLTKRIWTCAKLKPRVYSIEGS